MATFIVRVQLTRESTAHYTLLRDRLLDKGFTKRIRSKSGIEYRLPNGNYMIVSDRSIEVIFDVVQKVALTVDKTPMILVTEAKENGDLWAGLQKC